MGVWSEKAALQKHTKQVRGLAFSMNCGLMDMVSVPGELKVHIAPTQGQGRLQVEGLPRLSHSYPIKLFFLEKS
jgi:hypothetical protein